MIWPRTSKSNMLMCARKERIIDVKLMQKKVQIISWVAEKISLRRVRVGLNDYAI